MIFHLEGAILVETEISYSLAKQLQSYTTTKNTNIKSLDRRNDKHFLTLYYFVQTFGIIICMSIHLQIALVEHCLSFKR